MEAKTEVGEGNNPRYLKTWIPDRENSKLNDPGAVDVYGWYEQQQGALVGGVGEGLRVRKAEKKWEAGH